MSLKWIEWADFGTKDNIHIKADRTRLVYTSCDFISTCWGKLCDQKWNLLIIQLTNTSDVFSLMNLMKWHTKSSRTRVSKFRSCDYIWTINHLKVILVDVKFSDLLAESYFNYFGNSVLTTTLPKKPTEYMVDQSQYLDKSIGRLCANKNHQNPCCVIAILYQRVFWNNEVLLNTQSNNYYAANL